MTTRFCIISMCDSELRPGSKSDTCDTCKQGLRYWDNKSHAEVVERQQKLEKYQSRLARVGGKRKKPTLARTNNATRQHDSAARH